ncbi:hypothetical protein Tco_0373776 [Tanacetum coccineum]
MIPTSFSICHKVFNTDGLPTTSTYISIQAIELQELLDKELEGPMRISLYLAECPPTALSPGYIANSDPEEDKEDPEEDPADHPADG